MKIPDGVEGAALISACSRYRYWLVRMWDRSKPPVLFIMLNPSTASADEDDPTIRACCEFARNWGYGGIMVVNLYAFRATDPADMMAEPARIGENNDSWIYRLIPRCADVICAWGTDAEPDRVKRVLELIRLFRREPKYLRKTKDGHPSHPLARGKGFIPRTTQPTIWEG